MSRCLAVCQLAAVRLIMGRIVGLEGLWRWPWIGPHESTAKATNDSKPPPHTVQPVKPICKDDPITFPTSQGAYGAF